MDPKDEKRLERVFEEIATYEAIVQMLEDNPTDLSHLHLPLARNVLLQHRETVECVEKGKPLAASYFTNAPEIFTAMDVHWFHLIAQSFGGGMENPHMMEDLEGVDKLAVASDVCTLLRLGLYYLDAGVLPRPTMIIPLLEPCDGVIGLHEALRRHKEWRDIPTFTPDPPYHSDERSIEYSVEPDRTMLNVEEIKEMSSCINFQAHGVSHYPLTLLSEESLKSELIESKESIEEITGKSVYAFAYPYNRANNKVAKVVESCDYVFARVGGRIMNRPDTNRYFLNSIGIEEKSSVFELQNKLFKAELKTLL